MKPLVPQYITIHGARNGFLKVEVFETPSPHTNDHICLSWRASKAKRIRYLWLNDGEAAWAIQLLSAALRQRIEPDYIMTLEGDEVRPMKPRGDKHGKRK